MIGYCWSEDLLGIECVSFECGRVCVCEQSFIESFLQVSTCSAPSFLQAPAQMPYLKSTPAQPFTAHPEPLLPQ